MAKGDTVTRTEIFAFVMVSAAIFACGYVLGIGDRKDSPRCGEPVQEEAPEPDEHPTQYL
jgi:hypothetical protein